MWGRYVVRQFRHPGRAARVHSASDSDCALFAYLRKSTITELARKLHLLDNHPARIHTLVAGLRRLGL